MCIFALCAAGTLVHDEGNPDNQCSTASFAAQLWFPNLHFQMPQAQLTSYFVHQLLRARDWQHRPQFDEVCKWWRDGGRGVLALVGMGGAGKTAIAERFLRVLPGGLPDDPDIAKDATLRTPDSVFVFSFYDAPNLEAFFEAIQMWLEDSPRIENALSL